VAGEIPHELDAQMGGQKKKKKKKKKYCDTSILSKKNC
jgi:hypothetical protein